MRLFTVHRRRRTQSLDGFWHFAFLGDVAVDEVALESIRYTELMAVPCCFDATPKYAGKRGLTAYRRTIEAWDDSLHRLIFHSVHHWARIYVNGRPLGEHRWGNTRFEIDFRPETTGCLDLVVLVDNRFDFPRVPIHFAGYDWYQYGGITRPVELQRLGENWLNRMLVETLDHARRQVRIVIRYGSRRGAESMPLRLLLDEREVASETVTLAAGGGTIERLLELPEAECWSPEAPNLYLLRAELGDDDLTERIGIRQVRVEGRQLLLNDEPLRLLGVCRHEAHPQFGGALPESLMLSDLQQIQELGCNYVRAGHYTCDARFIDLCDEAGILVWAEANSWGLLEPELKDADIVEAVRGNIREMVDEQRNHPSIIIWGLLNECASELASSRPAYETLVNEYRQLDGSRPIAFASNRVLREDACLDLSDIIAINDYPGWYHVSIEEIGKRVDAVYEWLDGLGLGDRPIIHSEIGGGAIYGCRDAHGERWSEQYQARLLDEVIRQLFVNRERAIGVSIWQFCDVRTSTHARMAMIRPRCFNNKGIVDEYRRPKLAWDGIRRLYRELGSKP